MVTANVRTRVSKSLLFALFAAAPFCFLQFVFLANANRWLEFLFGYGAISLVSAATVFGLVIYAIAEFRLRCAAEQFRTPLFALVGGVMLLAFFVPAAVINPILLNFPRFCRVTQSIEWQTTRPNPEWDESHSFVLVVTGSGTRGNHSFSSGFINWTGKEPAGFSSIRFHPTSFDRNELTDRMANAGLAQTEISKLANVIWATCIQIDAGDEITARLGVVEPVDCQVDEHWDYFVGGWIWIALLSLAFVVVSFQTIASESAN